MSSDHLEFLKDKFINDLQEAVEELHEFPLRGHFDIVKKFLEATMISPLTPIVMKDYMHDLTHALAECCILSKKRQQHKTENKKSFFRGHGFVKEWWFLRRTREKLKNIRSELERINDKPSPDSPVSSNLDVQHQPREDPNFDTSKIHGFDGDLKKMEDILKTPDDKCGIKTIGIVGMGGSGKTALAQMVFNSPKVQQHFSPMIWVQLSEELNPENTDSREKCVRKILFQLHDNPVWNYCYLDELMHNLHYYLYKKKYLIVLDSVWHPSEWWFDLGSKSPMDGAGNYSRLSHGLPKRSGGAIIVTSRLEGVASRMVGVASRMVGEHYLHRILPPPKSDVWSIFMESIKTNPDDPTLLEMKDEIVDRCDGLPLAAKTLAEVISSQIGNQQ